jgi:hypothetical protein
MLKKFVVERDIEGLDELTPEELGYIASESYAAVSIIPGLQWLQSFVTNNKLYGLFLAEDASQLYEHAIIAGFPISKVSEVLDVIDPTAMARSRPDNQLTSGKTVASWFAKRRQPQHL